MWLLIWWKISACKVHIAIAQFNSEENKSNILKLPVLKNSVKVQQKIVDLINYNKSKKAE